MAFDYSISLYDPFNLGSAADGLLQTDLSAALGDWSTHLDGQGVLRVQLNIVPAEDSDLLASGGWTAGVVANVAPGLVTIQSGAEAELLTGRHVNGTSSDITISVPISALSSLYLNPDPYAAGAVPATLYDATSVFRHELMHGFGMGGYLPATDLPGLSRRQSVFDTYVLQLPDGSAYFTGPNAEAAFGGPLPLTTSVASELLYHLGNTKTGPLGNELMSGTGALPGQAYWISDVDLGILQDLGLPVGGSNVPTFGLSAVTDSAASGLPGTATEFDFTAIRHGDLSAALTLSYTVDGLAGGGAVLGAGVDDFPGNAYPGGTVSFAAGSNTATVAVLVAGTDVLKPSEAFRVVLNDPSGQASAAAGGTILNLVASSGALGVARDDAGIATIALQGAHGQYTVMPALYGSVTVQDSVAGRDGAQTVQHAATIQFTDGTGVFDATGNAEDVAHLYQAALGRAPDLDGLRYWTGLVDTGTLGIAAVAAGFLATPEFISDENEPGAEGGLVPTLYRNVLDRAPDTDGLAYWNGVLAGGGSQAAVLTGFAESPENLANTVGTIGDPQAAQAARLYRAAFGRTADAAGLGYWTGLLKTGSTAQQVATGFTATAEFAANYGGLNDAAYVQALYRNVLGRDADAGGAAYWQTQLQAGTGRDTVLQSFADTPENRARTASSTHDGWVFLAA